MRILILLACLLNLPLALADSSQSTAPQTGDIPIQTENPFQGMTDEQIEASTAYEDAEPEPMPETH